MDAEYLLGSLLRGVLTSRGKRKGVKGAMRLLLGNPQAVGAGALALGGLAYGLFESLNKSADVVPPGPLPEAWSRPRRCHHGRWSLMRPVLRRQAGRRCATTRDCQPYPSWVRRGRNRFRPRCCGSSG